MFPSRSGAAKPTKASVTIYVEPCDVECEQRSVSCTLQDSDD